MEFHHSFLPILSDMVVGMGNSDAYGVQLRSSLLRQAAMRDTIQQSCLGANQATYIVNVGL